MNRPRVRATLAFIGTCLLADALFAQPPTDIGTLAGYTASRPKNLDDHDDVLGQAVRPNLEPVEQAALWLRTGDGYAVEALPALPGLLRSDARAFARRGAPVGYAFLVAGGVSQFRATVWREDPSGLRVPVDLEPPPGFTDALALDANDHGLIVGEASNPRETINGSTVRHAVAWTPKGDGTYEVVDLGVPEGFDVSSASGVNALGEIVGTARRFESDGSGGLVLRVAVVVWPARFLHKGHCHADPLVLPSHPDLPRNQNPAINNTGLVIAQADRVTPGQPTVTRPLLWKRWHDGFAGPYELPVPQGFTDALPNDVNEPGSILGTAFVRQATAPLTVASQAVVWTWSGAKRRFVPTLLPKPPGTALVTAARINERGDAVGNAPLPAPGTTGGLLWKRKACGKWSVSSGLLEPQPEAP